MRKLIAGLLASFMLISCSGSDPKPKKVKALRITTSRSCSYDQIKKVGVDVSKCYFTDKKVLDTFTQSISSVAPELDIKIKKESDVFKVLTAFYVIDRLAYDDDGKTMLSKVGKELDKLTPIYEKCESEAFKKVKCETKVEYKLVDEFQDRLPMKYKYPNSEVKVLDCGKVVDLGMVEKCEKL